MKKWNIAGAVLVVAAALVAVLVWGGEDVTVFSISSEPSGTNTSSPPADPNQASARREKFNVEMWFEPSQPKRQQSLVYAGNHRWVDARGFGFFYFRKQDERIEVIGLPKNEKVVSTTAIYGPAGKKERFYRSAKIREIEQPIVESHGGTGVNLPFMKRFPNARGYYEYKMLQEVVVTLYRPGYLRPPYPVKLLL